MHKYTKIITLFLAIISTFSAFFVSLPMMNNYTTTQVVYAEDILETISTPSKDNNQILDPGNSATAVGNELIRGGYTLDKDGNRVRKDPLVVRITRIILEVVIALGVTMCIVIGIMYVISQGDETKQKKLLGYFWNILWGILIALAADVIIILVRSISQSSVTL